VLGRISVWAGLCEYLSGQDLCLGRFVSRCVAVALIDKTRSESRNEDSFFDVWFGSSIPVCYQFSGTASEWHNFMSRNLVAQLYEPQIGCTTSSAPIQLHNLMGGDLVGKPRQPQPSGKT
jgi:hypothetical protein